jgi:hypothetical protein
VGSGSIKQDRLSKKLSYHLHHSLTPQAGTFVLAVGQRRSRNASAITRLLPLRLVAPVDEEGVHALNLNVILLIRRSCSANGCVGAHM